MGESGRTDTPVPESHHVYTHGHALRPTNNLVGPLLTDLYQITMSYAYWYVAKLLSLHSSCSSLPLTLLEQILVTNEQLTHFRRVFGH
jgi:hypothetical protein